MEYRKLLKKITVKLSNEKALEEALYFSRENLVLDPYDEEIHREIMTLHAKMGDRNTALRQYEICLKSMEVDLGFPLEEETQILADQIRKGDYRKNNSSLNKDFSFSKNKIPRLAVLPFTLHGTIVKIQPDLCEIAAEAIADYCSSVDGIEVISRTSTLSYRNSTKNLPRIAAELRVNYIIEGIVEIHPDYLIMTIRLIDASKDTVLSTNKMELPHKPKEVISIATQIICDFLKILKIELKPDFKEKNDPGLPWRLHAKSLLRDSDEESKDLAIKSYNRAIDLNPEDAGAWAGIANSLQLKGNIGFLGSEINDIYLNAEVALNRALSINQNEPTAIYVRGIIAEERDWDYRTAEKSYFQALEYNPENPEILTACSSLLIRQNKLNEALLMAERAYEIDPVNMYTISAKYWTYVAAELYRKADQMNVEARTFFPHRSWNEFDRGLMQVYLGNSDKAIPILEAIKSTLILENKQTLLFILAYAYADIGRNEEADKIIELMIENRESFTGFHIPLAAVYTVMGKHDLALQWIEKAVESRDPGIVFLALYPFYKPLYKNPRYINALNTVHITLRE